MLWHRFIPLADIHLLKPSHLLLRACGQGAGEIVAGAGRGRGQRRQESATVKGGARRAVVVHDGAAGGDVEGASVGLEALTRDVEGFVLIEGGAGGDGAGGGGGARGGSPEGAAFVWGGGWEVDAAVVDFWRCSCVSGGEGGEGGGGSP